MSIRSSNTLLTYRRFDALATQTHAAIIPSCGFDSLPSDLVVHRAAQTLRSHLGPSAKLRQSVTAVSLNGASVSGGSLSTAISAAESVPKSLLRVTSKNWSNSPGMVLFLHNSIFPSVIDSLTSFWCSTTTSPSDICASRANGGRTCVRRYIRNESNQQTRCSTHSGSCCLCS